MRGSPNKPRRASAYHQSRQSRHGTEIWSLDQLEDIHDQCHYGNAEELAKKHGFKSAKHMRKIFSQRGIYNPQGKALRVPDYAGWDFSKDNVA